MTSVGPSTPIWLDRADNPMSGKFKAKQALSCAICGVMYQLADNTEIFRAATASGGDLVEYILWMRNDELVCETEAAIKKTSMQHHILDKMCKG